MAISLGSTQPPAELSTESAMPTTVRVTLPAAPGMVSCVPSGTVTPLPGLGSLASTSCPGPSAQCPDCRVRSSTGPPGEARPATSIGPQGNSPPGPDCLGLTVTSANGPAAAVTSASRVVAASSALVALAGSTIAITCAPRWAANA